MPRLPVVSGRQLVRALQRAGFEEVRQKGSHAILIHRARNLVTVVPVHGSKDLPPGTLSAIMRDTGLTADDLRELL